MPHGPSFSPRGSSSIAAMCSLASTVALLVADQSAPLRKVGLHIGGDLLDYRTAAVSATVECPQRTDQRSADDCRPDHCPAHLLGTRVHVSLLRASCHPAKAARSHPAECPSSRRRWGDAWLMAKALRWN